MKEFYGTDGSRLFTSLANLGLGLLLCLGTIGLAVTVVLHFRPLYYGCIDGMNLTTVGSEYGLSDLSYGEIREDYDALIDYNSLFGPAELEFPHLPASENGLFHFAEVKRIFLFFEVMGIVCASLAGVGIFLKYRHIASATNDGGGTEVLADTPSRDDVNRHFRGNSAGASSMSQPSVWMRHGHLLCGGAITVLLPSLLGIFIALDFDRLFVLFHELVFSNDYWIFYYDLDPIILYLPEDFFMLCAMLIVLLVLLSALAMLAAYLVIFLKGRKSTTP